MSFARAESFPYVIIKEIIKNRVKSFGQAFSRGSEIPMGVTHNDYHIRPICAIPYHD